MPSSAITQHTMDLPKNMDKTKERKKQVRIVVSLFGGE